MQLKTFNRLLVVTMALSIVLPLSVWYLDSLIVDQSWFAHILGGLALMAMPIIWLVGNFITGIAAVLNRPLIGRLFWAQCLISALILIGFIVWQLQIQLQKNQQDLRHQVVQAVIAGNKANYKQALTNCADVCKNQDKTTSVSSKPLQYDEYAYKEWLVAAVAAQSHDILDDLLLDPSRPNISLVGSGAPYLTLNDSCRGYFVGEANVYQIAVLQKTSKILQRLIASASIDDKSSALWYAAQANKINYIQLLLAAGANRNIKDEYGVNGVENAGYSLLDAAVEGYAVETLQWLLDNGFAANGQLGKTPNGQNETANLKHTPLHNVLYMAQREQQQFNSLRRSLQMWQILKKAGADDTIAAPQSYGASQTPLQFLLQSNVYDDSAKVVQAFVNENISKAGLTAAQESKLQMFLNTKLNADSLANEPASNLNCAENWLRQQYNVGY